MFYMAQFATALCSLPIYFLLTAAPEIIEFFISGVDEVALEGDQVILFCRATAEPSLTMLFEKDGMQLLKLPANPARKEFFLGLHIGPLKISDTGNYTCQVSNIHGTQSATAHLQVLG